MPTLDDMNAKSPDEKSREGRKDYLAYEYLRISEQLAASGARGWQAAAFLVGGAFAGAGLLAAREEHGLHEFVQTLILGLGVIVSLFFFLHWFIRREDWRNDILRERENEIEEELHLYSRRYIRWLDYRRTEGRFPAEVPVVKLSDLEDLHGRCPSPGRDNRGTFTRAITCAAILVWVALIVTELLAWQVS